MGTVLTSDIGFKVMKDVFKEEIEEYKYIEAQETIRNNTEKKERQQNWIKTLVNDDNEFCVEGPRAKHIKKPKIRSNKKKKKKKKKKNKTKKKKKKKENKTERKKKNIETKKSNDNNKE